MKTQAAILVEQRKPLVLMDLELPELAHGQVLIEVAFSGVCRTQLLEIQGLKGPDPYLPHCLGHEGSGTVCQIGPGVTKVSPGDRVILSWMKGRGIEAAPPVYHSGKARVNAGPIATFGRHAILSENRLVKLPAAGPLMEACLVGCSVATGIGAVLHTASAKAGQTVVVFGTGGIGAFAVAGARLAGCPTVIAVDVSAQRLEVARELGATHVLSADEPQVATRLASLSPSGVDIAIEATGNPSVMRLALETVRPRGGRAVVIGNAGQGDKLEIDPRHLNMGKSLLGTWGGDNQPDVDFPQYLKWIEEKKLNITPFTRSIYSLDRINDAIQDFNAGRCLRPVIRM